GQGLVADQVTAEQRVEEGLQVGRRGGHLARGPVEGDVLVGDVDGRAVVQGGRGADRRGGQPGVAGGGGAGQGERVEDAGREGGVLVGGVDGRAVVPGGRGAGRRGGQPGVVGEGGAGQVERVEDAAPDDGVVRPARDRLDEAAGHDVVGVRVAEVGAGREVRV